MFRKKKMLYKDREYLLLPLSVISDIAITTFCTSAVFAIIWSVFSQSHTSLISWCWKWGIGLTIFVGIPSKILDIKCIGYHGELQLLKGHKFLFIHYILTFITMEYWAVMFYWMIRDLFL